MDQKTCLRGKRSPKKSIAVNSSGAENSVNGNEKEVASLFSECNVKNRLLSEYAKAVQEANTGRERAEALVATRKPEQEDILHRKVAALKNLLRVEQHRRVHLESAHKRLHSKYTEARKKLGNLTVENTQLTRSLVKKEEIIKDVNNQMSEAKKEFNALISRLYSTERGNNVLKYEYCLLEKELKIRSRHADVAKLEAERQKLRLLVKKRITGPTKINPSSCPKAVDRQMSFMIKQLCEAEEENKTLKQSACKRENEIRHLKAELEVLKESKKMPEDHFENLKLINFDLDRQLSEAKVQIKEALRKVCFLEMELEERSHHYEGLEATCLELQLQLASVSGKDRVIEDLEQEGKLFDTVSSLLSRGGKVVWSG